MALKPISELTELSLLLGPEDDMHEVFRVARNDAPLARNPMGMIMALRARHMDAVLSEATRQMETEPLLIQGVTDGPLMEMRRQILLFSNGEVHRRRRQPLARTFAFKLMEGMRSTARDVAEDLVQTHAGEADVDFLNAIAAQVPQRLIADILGVPRADLPYLQRLVDDAVQTLGFFDPALRSRYEASSLEFNDYVGGLLEDRRRSPRGDFLTEFAAAADAAGELSEAEMRADIIALIVAGSDTTKNSIAMTLALLLDHPEQWTALCADPEGLKKGAAAEGLRFEPVAFGVPRLAVSDFELDGYAVTAGSMIFLVIPSACRDEDVYRRPDVFDIARSDHPRWHFAFGGGAHRCLGEALARVEIEETLSAVARLCPGARIAGARPRMSVGAIRAVDQLRVTLA